MSERKAPLSPTAIAGVIWALGVYVIGVLVNAPVLWAAWTLGGGAIFAVWLERQKAREAREERARREVTARPPR